VKLGCATSDEKNFRIRVIVACLPIIAQEKRAAQTDFFYALVLRKRKVCTESKDFLGRGKNGSKQSLI